MITISYALRSDVGCVRTNNEDTILLNREFCQDESRDGSFFMHNFTRFAAIVADGMGGHEGGEFASQLAVESFDEFLNILPDELLSDNIVVATKEWAQRAHNLINTKGIELPQFRGMGTTFVGLFSYEGRVFTINIGDSRLYRYRNGILKQISEDHSMRNLTGDQTQQSNLIYNSLGAGETVFADVEDVTERILPGDHYLVCSDGITDMLTDEQIDAVIEEAMQNNWSDRDLVEHMVDAAKVAGGKDNISAIWLTISEKA